MIYHRTPVVLPESLSFSAETPVNQRPRNDSSKEAQSLVFLLQNRCLFMYHRPSEEVGLPSKHLPRDRQNLKERQGIRISRSDVLPLNPHRSGPRLRSSKLYPELRYAPLRIQS